MGLELFRAKVPRTVKLVLDAGLVRPSTIDHITQKVGLQIFMVVISLQFVLYQERLQRCWNIGQQTSVVYKRLDIQGCNLNHHFENSKVQAILDMKKVQKEQVMYRQRNGQLKLWLSRISNRIVSIDLKDYYFNDLSLCPTVWIK